jgi:hypothetical protein
MSGPDRKTLIAAGLLWTGTFVFLALPFAWLGAYVGATHAPWSRLAMATVAALAAIAVAALLLRDLAAYLYPFVASLALSGMVLALGLGLAAFHRMDARLAVGALASAVVGFAGVFLTRRLYRRDRPRRR